MRALDQRVRRIYDHSLEEAFVPPPGRFLLWVVFVLYHAARILKSSLYLLGILPRVRLGVPTVSVGNLTMGGTGKTPFTVWLVRHLARDRRHAVVLSRGYRRRSREWMVWVSRSGRLLADALAAGDEAWLLARQLPEATVLSGRRRASTGRLAVDTVHPDLVVLDDGQQYWRLHRDLDIALVDLPLRRSQKRLFPFGELREPLSRLRCADLIVLTRADQVAPAQREAATRWLDEVAPRVPRAWASLIVRSVRDRSSGGTIDPLGLRGKRLLALSNVAQPKNFLRTLQIFEPAIVIPCSFPDHHPYGPADEVTLLTDVMSEHLDAIVMTEKDDANIPPGFRFPCPAHVIEVDLEVRGDGFELVPYLEERLFLEPGGRRADPFPGSTPGERRRVSA